MPIPSGPVPLGYGFRPFDWELITHLKRKISGGEENEVVIAEIDIYKFDPWELPAQSKIKNDDPQWFFFSLNQLKFSRGSRWNRATTTGFWKPTGEDRTIISMESGQEKVIGRKKTLVFYKGRGSTRESTSWTIHEYSSADNQDSYVLCRLFKNQEPKQRKKRKKAIECSNDAEHEIELEVQLNQRTEEEFSAQPTDEVNSVASLDVIQEENNFMTENFDTDDDGVEMNEVLNPCEDNEEPVVGEAGNGEFPRMHSDNELLNENFAKEYSKYLLNLYNISGASQTLIRGESSMTSVNVDTDDVGAENNEEVLLQRKKYNEEVLKYHAETLLADSPPNLGDNLMASLTVNTHDIDEQVSKYFDALQDPEETNTDETVNDEVARMHSRMDFDSVTVYSSSSYNYRTPPVQNPVIRHAGGDDHRILNEFVSEGSTNQYADTGIRSRVPTNDTNRQHQGTARRRILLKRSPSDERCERIQQTKFSRSGFALVLLVLVLIIVYVGWKWLCG